MAQGKILHTACANVSSELITSATETALSLGMPTFAGIQNNWNLLIRDIERDIVPAALRSGIGIVPYFPLASGMLTGKYKRGEEFPPDSALRQTTLVRPIRNG